MAAYTKLSIPATEEQSEILSAYLADFPFDSFDYDGEMLNAYAPQSEMDELHQEVETMLKEEGFTNFFFEDIEAQNWNASWESDFEEVEVREEVLIRAPFHQKRPGYQGMEVIIQPKMSFGTGHHSTTQLMIEALLDGEIEGKRILDMGSGTGVLANINRNILLADMEAYVATMPNGGKLVMSGFLAEDVEILKEKAQSFGYTLTNHRTNDVWQALEFEKSDNTLK